MRLVIYFHDSRSGKVIMKDGKRIIDQADFNLERNLEGVLTETIDKILERNRMNLFTLKTVQLGGKLDHQSLAYHLAVSFKKALIS